MRSTSLGSNKRQCRPINLPKSRKYELSARKPLCSSSAAGWRGGPVQHLLAPHRNGGHVSARLSAHHCGRGAGSLVVAALRKAGCSPAKRVETGRGAHNTAARCSSSAWQGVARQTKSRLGVARLKHDKTGTFRDG